MLMHKKDMNITYMKCMDAFKFAFILAFVFLFSVASAQPSSGSRVIFLAHEYPASIMELRDKIQTKINQDIAALKIEDIARKIQPNDLVVLLGRKALEQSSKIPQEATTVASLIARQDYLKYRAYLDTAVFSEPPIERNVLLAKQILGDDTPLGVLVSSKEAIPSLNYKKVTFYPVDEYESLNHALTDLFSESQALIGVYDQALYSPQNIKTILISSYRQERPLIGPSRAYISAGALASTFSSLDDVATRLAEVIDSIANDQVIPEANYNPYYKVGVNQQVGRSLNLDPLNAKAIGQSLNKLEHL